jgi:prevent-host-death family protein
MDVSVSVFRAHLSEWVERARAGEEVVLTDRGRPVARLVPADHRSFLERLEAEGVVGPSPGPKPKASELRKVRAKGSVSDVVIEQRG